MPVQTMLKGKARLGLTIARAVPPRHRSSLRGRTVVLCLIWIISIFPFVLLRRDTWFGRPLSDQQIGEYLHADEKPKQIEYALGQISQRMARRDSSVSIWYPDLARLASHRLQEVRAIDAQVMGENAALPSLHSALEEQLNDSSQIVRFNAAVSLARVRDDVGHDEIITMLSETNVRSDLAMQGLSALQQIGDRDDLPVVAKFEIVSPQIPERVRQQAAATATAIKARAPSQPEAK